jgi:hypothetical protein
MKKTPHDILKAIADGQSCEQILANNGMEWAPLTADQNAAWEPYVELLTRITTRALPAHTPGPIRHHPSRFAASAFPIRATNENNR